MIILIATCSKYNDVVSLLAFFFNLYWPDCPYRKILINSGSENTPGFEAFNTPTDLGWTANILYYLKAKSVEENVLLLHDDYLPLAEINTKEIQNINERIDDAIGYIRLLPTSDNDYNTGLGWKWPSFQPFDEHYNIAFVNRNPKVKGTGLPFSHQPAVWNSKCVRQFFNPDLTPWQQEIFHSREYSRQGTIGGVKCDYLFLTTKVPVFPYLNAIRDGKYASELVELIRDIPELQATLSSRDIAIKYESLPQAEKKRIVARQTDGTYPLSRYQI